MPGFDFALLIPLAGIGLPMVLAVIVVLAEHQRKMTKLLQKTTATSDQALAQVVAELQSLRHDVNRIQDQVSQLSIASDFQPSLSGRFGQSEQVLSEKA